MIIMIFISHNPVNLVNPVKNDFLCLSLCSLWLKPDSHTSSHGRNFIGCVPMFSCTVRGVLVVNKTPGKKYRPRQAPIEVQLSEDGKEWQTVFTDKKVRNEYRVDLGNKKTRAKFIRVRRTPNAKNEVFHLNKILVYGDRLY